GKALAPGEDVDTRLGWRRLRRGDQLRGETADGRVGQPGRDEVEAGNPPFSVDVVARLEDRAERGGAERGGRDARDQAVDDRGLIQKNSYELQVDRVKG